MENDRIIVLLKLENLIEANIVKTKLDAYGIPCFLTEENLTHLTTHLLSGGIRLHIFEKDTEKARHILLQDYLVKEEDDGIIHCPKCNSKRILTTRSESLHGKMNQAIMNLLLGISGKHYCLHCGNEF